MDNEIRNQILAVRDTGATNMFDARRVKEIAEMLGFDELADFLNDRRNHKVYANFILTGK
ncbi:DUF5049 domain-containing protein [uncultured Selenomonas sp.]|uniref:DUF5049 domain-containing protein n=1 Tax=uncultured Selenomonas sp. TaxID=159275 RepID=UPI002587B0AD|nr:DUF5049 domain-containing protein [uncultured Selenomonas sp.]